jgi:uncharacterized membrane protein YqjE
MDTDSRSAERHAEALSTRALIKEITSEVSLLAKQQIELAKVELRADLKHEVGMVTGLGVSAIAALMTLNLLLVTAVFALASIIPGWAAGLIVSAFTLVVAGMAAVIGWNKRVRSPLARTRQTLKEDVQWTKERLA